MFKRSDTELLKDIIESRGFIEEYITGYSEEDFHNNRKKKDAVVRNFEIIGEASNPLILTFKKNNFYVKWREATDLRNKIIHDYSGLDYVLIWEIIHIELRPLKQQIQTLLLNPLPTV